MPRNYDLLVNTKCLNTVAVGWMCDLILGFFTGGGGQRFVCFLLQFFNLYKIDEIE